MTFEDPHELINMQADIIASRKEAAETAQLLWLFWHTLRTTHPATGEQWPADHCTHMALAWMGADTEMLEDEGDHEQP
jgi:hypothetical protein